MPIQIFRSEIAGSEMATAAYVFDKLVAIPDVSRYPWLVKDDHYNDEQKHGNPLCRVCRQINFEYLFEVATAEMAVSVEDISAETQVLSMLWDGLCLGSIHDIQERLRQAVDGQLCQFCIFILGSIRNLSDGVRPGAVFPIASKAATRVHLRSLIRGPTTVSFQRTPLGSDECRKPTAIQLMISLRVGQEPLVSSPRLPLIQKIIGPEKSAKTGEWNASLSGRYLGEDNIDFEVLRGWISACRDKGCRPPRVSRTPKIRLIDVSKGFVTDAFDSPPEYAALSYVWGRAKNMMLTAKTMTILQTPGTVTLHNPDIPRTIRDALLACQFLAEPYLWVDSICIQQDSSLKMLTIGEMDAIYGCARITLVAAAGSDAEAGLYGVRRKSRPRPQRIVHVTNSITIADVLPPIKETVDQSVWNRRGWTYQERILSNQKLYFTAEQAYYECIHGLSCQDNLFDVHVTGAPSNDVQGTPGGEPETKYRIDLDDTLNFTIYEGIVREFTARTLTFEEDADMAFRGVANALQHRIFNGSPLLFGIPVCCIDLALLWYPSGHLDRRRCNSDATCTVKYFPSWTWMGWKGTFNVDSIGNVSERLRSCVHWIDTRDSTTYVPRELTGMPPPSWAEWPQWTRHIDRHGFAFYTSEAEDPKIHFCHPLRRFQAGDSLPIDTKSGQLRMQAQVARLTVSGTHTGRWDEEPPCASGNHSTATCQLWICDATGERAGIVYVDGDYYMKDFGPAANEFTFIKLSQGTYSVGSSDPAWDEKTKSYRGIPGSAAINPQDPLGPEDEIFDQTAYDPNICWCLYNVLLVEWTDGVAYRVGIGQVHMNAFDEAYPEWRTISVG